MKNLFNTFIEYLQKEKKYSPHTQKAYLDDLVSFQKYLDSAHDFTAIQDVIYVQIRTWIVSLVDNGLTNVTINRKIASLKSFYLFLQKTKTIAISPLLIHKPLKSIKKIQIPFSEKELNLLLDNNYFEETFEGRRNKLIIEMFYSTGIRRSELINLQTNNIDFSNKTIKVLGKRNKERIIPMLPNIASEGQLYFAERLNLEMINEPSFFFLQKNGNKLSESFVYRLINNYFSNVSEKVKRSPHVIRHSFATQLLNHGADLNSVKELLGHSSLASTQIYTHSSLAELKQVYSRSHPRNKQ